MAELKDILYYIGSWQIGEERILDQISKDTRAKVRVAALVVTRPAAPPLLARHVSNLINPLVVAVPLLFVAALREQSLSLGFFHLLLALVGLVVVPATYIVAQVQRGTISDLHISQRNQRAKPLFVSLLSAIVTLLLLSFSGTETTMLKLVYGTLLTTVLLAGVTIFWKISFHAAATTSAVITTLWLLGPYAVPVLLLIPLVGWARIAMRAHTPAQVICGVAVGFSVALLVLSRF